MAEFTVNPQRHDPYKGFKFRVKWDGRYVAGASKVSGLKRSTEAVRHRGGGEANRSSKTAGGTRHGAISIERGVTHDTEFEHWANMVSSSKSAQGAGVSLDDLRKDVIIDLFDEAGQLAMSYKFFRCWISEYQALPDLDANANAVVIEHLKLENEGWESNTVPMQANEVKR